MNAQVLGISVDHVPCLQAWAKKIGGISYPLLSDFWPHGEVIQRYGFLREEGYSERALVMVDRGGIIRHIRVHNIDEQPDNEELFAVLRELEPEAAKRMSRQRQSGDLPTGGIVMYCSKWCPDCPKARDWLEGRGLEYVEVDVNAVKGAADQVRRWTDGKLVTPTFDIDGTIVVDFDEERLSELLK